MRTVRPTGRELRALCFAKSRVVAIAALVALAFPTTAWPTEPKSEPHENSRERVLQPATLTEVLATPVGFERNRATYGLLATAGRGSVEQLLDEIDNLPGVDGRDVARVAYLRLAALDPEAAVAHALGANVEPSLLSTVFRSWAHRDLDSAVSRAAALPEDARMAVAHAILELDLPTARLLDIADRLGVTELLIEIEVRRNRANIEASWNRAVADTDDPLREVQLRVVAEIWSAEDPAAALAASELLPVGELRDDLRRLIVDVWSGVDPDAAVAWFSTSAQDELELIEVSFAALAERDLSRAWSFSEPLPINPRSRARRALLRAALTEDFDGALAFFNSLPEDEVGSGELAMLVLSAFGDQPRSALEWAMSRDEGSRIMTTRYRRGVMLDTYERNLWQWVDVFGGRSPMLARTVIEEIVDVSSRDFAAAAYLALGPGFGPTSWPGRDRRADVLWAESVASEQFLQRPQIANILVNLAPDHGIEVLLRRDPSPARDEAIRAALVRSIALRALTDEHAERLLTAISSADTRRTAARRLYLRGTGRTDPEEIGARQEFLALCRHEFDQ